MQFTDMIKVDPLDVAAWLVATAVFAAVLTALVIALVDRTPVRPFGNRLMPNAAYDPTTLLGQTRLHAADTVTGTATFADNELAYFLTLSSNDPIGAAAFALEALAADASRLAIVIKSQGLDIDRTDLADSLAARALSLRMQAGTGGSVDSPDAIFTTDNSTDSTTGSMSGW